MSFKSSTSLQLQQHPQIQGWHLINACSVNTEYDAICNINTSTYICVKKWVLVGGSHQTAICGILLGDGGIQHYLYFYLNFFALFERI